MASGIKDHRVVPHDEWLEARKALLAKEKEFTRQRDELSRQRRELPWEKVEKTYVFDGLRDKETLADLFENRSQLVVYHFMFSPDWNEGCPHCSFWADNFNGIRTRGNQRVLQGRTRRHFSHLLHLRARNRHDEHRLSLPRPGSQRAR